MTLTLASTPAGAPLSYAGEAGSAPWTRTTAIGFDTTVTADERFTSNGRTYIFDRWSDGGARSHDIRVPAVDSTLRAFYHLVGTHDGARVRVYVNGVERASVAYTGGIAWAATRDLWLGRQHKSSGRAQRFLDGRLDEVALYRSALSAATVQSHFGAGRP